MFNQLLCKHPHMNSSDQLFDICEDCGIAVYKHYKTFIEPCSNIEFVCIHGGTFMMGDDYEIGSDMATIHSYPQHQVTVKSFWMGKYPVTQKQWQIVMHKDFKNNESEFDNYPINNISYLMAKQFIIKLNESPKQTMQYTYSIPSEAQWEYACRAGTTTAYFFGNDADLSNQYAWTDSNSHNLKQPVGLLLPNQFGIYDIVGNIETWCEDSYHQNYKDAPIDDQPWYCDGELENIVRGGSFYYRPWYCASASRGWAKKRDTYSNIGLRVVATI